MTEGQYWNGDPALVKAYRKAEEHRMQQKNTELWLQGMYVYEAIMDLSPILRSFVKNPKAEKYSSKPYPLTEKERRERAEQEEKAEAEALKAALEAQAMAFNKKLQENADGGREH